jgi:hypothetical protein
MHHLNSRLRIPLLALVRVGLRRPKRRAAPATTAGRPALAQGLVGIGLTGELQRRRAQRSAPIESPRRATPQ